MPSDMDELFQQKEVGAGSTGELPAGESVVSRCPCRSVTSSITQHGQPSSCVRSATNQESPFRSKMAMGYVLLLLFLFLQLSQQTQAQDQRPDPTLMFRDFQTDVGLRKTDLMVIMDRSSSMNKHWFYMYVKKVVRGLIERYVVVHPDYVRIAIITFAKDVTVDVDGITDPAITKCSLMNGENADWHKVFFKTTEDNLVGTNIIDSFLLAKQLMESPMNLRRNETKKIVLLLTDGAYQVAQDPYRQQQELVQLGYHIYTIGLGSWHVTGNVRQLASKPEYYGNITQWNNHIKGSMRSPGPEIGPLYVPTSTSDCEGGCGTNSTCFCEALTGDFLCRCPKGFTNNTSRGGSGCTKCPVHSFKSAVGNELCTDCPKGTGTYQAGGTTYSECLCFNSNDNICQTQKNPCDTPNICLGANETCVFQGPFHRCECKPGYVWDSNSRLCLLTQHCENSLEQLPCQHGHCVEMVDDFTCECDTAFTGRLCNINIDECRHPICDNGGNCTDGNNDFTCACPADWKGQHCRDRITTIPTTTTPTTTTPTTTTPTTTTPTTTTPTTTTPTTTTPTTTTTKKSGSKVQDSNNATNAASSSSTLKDYLLYIIVGAVLGFALLIVLLVVLLYVCCCRDEEKPTTNENNTSTMASSTSTSTGTQMSVRFSKNNRPRQSIYKSISQRFSGIWKSKTIRGGMWADDDNTKTGAPSAPSKRRPDLIASSLVSTDPKSHDLDEIVVSNEEIAAPTGMEGWVSYLEDLQNAGVIKYGVIAHVDGAKVANSQAYIYNPREVDAAHELLLDLNTNVILKIQDTAFNIESNIGDVATGRTTEEKAEPEVILLSHTKKFIIALIAWENQSTDMETLDKELQFIVDHISAEGY